MSVLWCVRWAPSQSPGTRATRCGDEPGLKELRRSTGSGVELCALRVVKKLSNVNAVCVCVCVCVCVWSYQVCVCVYGVTRCACVCVCVLVGM